MKRTIAALIMVSVLSIPVAKIPQLNDTTIAVFPTTNPGDSLRFKKIYYNDSVESLVCYRIGKTLFPYLYWFKPGPDTFPEFDDAEILVSNSLKNIANGDVYNSFITSFPGFFKPDTVALIKSMGPDVSTTYYHCSGLYFIFSFNLRKVSGVDMAVLETYCDPKKPVYVIYDIFSQLPQPKPTATRIILKNNSEIGRAHV